MKRTKSLQPDSAIASAGSAGITQGQTSRVNLVVGITPDDEQEKQPQAAHFCSSRMTVTHTHMHGSGESISATQDVVIRGSLPVIQHPVIARFDATVRSNGRLTFNNPGPMKVVVIPDSIVGNDPWSYDGGAEHVATALGCNGNLDEMFKRHGEPVSA